MINPEITWRSKETFQVWDDCLSVPNSIVRVERHSSISVRYVDQQNRRHHWEHLPASMSELVQHEVDHLDGVLMTDRAIDSNAILPIEKHGEVVASGEEGILEVRGANNFIGYLKRPDAAKPGPDYLQGHGPSAE